MQTCGSRRCDLVVALVVSGDGSWAPMRARLKAWFGARRLYHDALVRCCFTTSAVATMTKWSVQWLQEATDKIKIPGSTTGRIQHKEGLSWSWCDHSFNLKNDNTWNDQL